MAQVENNKESQSSLEILESSEALQEAVIDKTEAFAKKNQTLLIAVLAILVLAVGGFLFWQYQLEENDKQAQIEAFPAVYFFEQDSMKQALKGDGNTTDGFEKIIDDYGSTKTGKLAHVYVGVTKLKQGQYDEAIQHFKAFSSSDLLLQARVYALTGDAYMEKNDTDNAISFYKKAVDYKTNAYLSIPYMLKLATAYEAKNDIDNAKKIYQRILKDYPKSEYTLTAKRYLYKSGGIAKN